MVDGVDLALLVIHHNKENSKNPNQIKCSVAGEDEIKYK